MANYVAGFSLIKLRFFSGLNCGYDIFRKQSDIMLYLLYFLFFLYKY